MTVYIEGLLGSGAEFCHSVWVRTPSFRTNSSTRSRLAQKGATICPASMTMHNALISLCCWRVRGTVLTSVGEPTTIARHCARDSATFKRLMFSTNERPRSKSLPWLCAALALTAPASESPLPMEYSSKSEWQSETITMGAYMHTDAAHVSMRQTTRRRSAKFRPFPCRAAVYLLPLESINCANSDLLMQLAFQRPYLKVIGRYDQDVIF